MTTSNKKQKTVRLSLEQQLNDSNTKYQKTTKEKRYLHNGGMEKQLEITSVWTSNELPVG